MSRIGDLNKHQPRPFLTASCTTYRGHLDENVDDFIGVAQGDHQTLNQVRSTLHYSMDVMFCPNDVSDSTVQVEPVSLNKLDKGHASSWKAKHTILGRMGQERWTITLSHPALKTNPRFYGS